MQTPARGTPTPPALRATRAPAVRRTLLIILALNVLVVGIKITVGLRTDSLAVLGAALESSLDLLNNIVGMVLVKLAALEPDEDHPYGHEKFETLGALAIVGFLSISCFELLREGVRHAIGGHVPKSPTIPELGLLVLTVAINFFVVWYERRRARSLSSAFLMADAAHTGSDIYVTLAALASLLLTRAGWGIVDPLLAVGVALVIAWNGYQIFRATVPVLVDERAVDAGHIGRLVSTIPQIVDVRSVRSRWSASGVLFAEITVAVAGSISVAEAHALADAVEDKIGKELGPSEVTVHVEPA